MQIKEGVILNGLQIEMRPVLIAAESIWKSFHQELVVTGGLDGEHSAGSLHYYGFALDFRTRYFSEEVVDKVAEDLRRQLGTDYDVIVHRSHIHVEYDPK